MMIYLDHNATTPVGELVLAEMLPWFRQHPGNPASGHAPGRTASAAVERARGQVAAAIGALPSEVVFTSGSTEATNIALRGSSGRIVVASTEHKAVLDTAAQLDATLVPVDDRGVVDFGRLKEVVEGAGLVSIMLANNETGVIQDLKTIAAIAHRAGALVHTDATQALGKMPVNVMDLAVDLASFSAHKLEGPKGTGCLYVRRGVRLSSSVTGGGHERGLRSGTLNVPGIVGFGEAAERAVRSLVHRRERMRSGTERLLDLLREAEPVEVYSDHNAGLPNTLSIRFVGADGEAVMANASTVAMSLGSACTSAVPEPSHVLRAMGVPVSAAFEVLRLSVGPETTDGEIEAAAKTIVDAVAAVRRLADPSTVDEIDLREEVVQ